MDVDSLLVMEWEKEKQHTEGSKLNACNLDFLLALRYKWIQKAVGLISH